MGILFNLGSQPSGNAQAYPQAPAQPPSALSRVGEIADILLTGGMFHALNQRSIQQNLLRQQAQDRAALAGMFRPGSTTQAPAAPLPDPADPLAQGLFRGSVNGVPLSMPTQSFGGDSVHVTPPQSPTMEQFMPQAAQAAAHGVDVAPFLSMIQAAQPDIQFVNGQAVDRRRVAAGSRIGVNLQNVNNRMVDTQNPDNANLTVPQVDKGQVATYDARGNPVGVMNLAGNADAQAQVAGAVSGAQEYNKAKYDLVDVPLANGSTVKMPRLLASQALGGQVKGLPAGLGVTQTPAEKALAEERAKTQGQREQLQPKELGALQDLDNTSGMTSQIIHQILGDVQNPKTGAWAAGGKPLATGMTTGAIGELLHAVPGTPQHDLDQQLEHIRAMTSIEQLQNLRDNSPTGAGLGRVTQSEINLLAAMRGSIDQGQRRPQFEANLRRQLGQLDAMISNRRSVYNSTYGDIEQPTPGQTAPKAPAYNGQSGKAAAAPSRDAMMSEARRRGLIK